MKFLFFVLSIVLSIKSYATVSISQKNIETQTYVVYVAEVVTENNNPNPILKLIKKRQRLNKKITAAALAFPFPFGIVGLHRIYLGTKPHVPIVYIATLGGVFGILPLVDFFVIIADKDFEQYKNNGKVFMWIKD